MFALPMVGVRTARSMTIGLLFFKTSSHIVLLNNILEGANFGRMRNLVRNHFSHEADITIIPARDVEEIELIKAAK